MKGFIEVFDRKNRNYLLINISLIEMVYGSTIYIAFNTPNALEQDFIACKESYEAIKEKIREAERGKG